MNTLKLEKITYEQKKEELRLQIEQQKKKLDEDKKMINKEQEKMVKEMFNKWGNMQNAKLIVKEADSVT